jgi:hypothetical protein
MNQTFRLGRTRHPRVQSSGFGEIVAHPILGGLHHQPVAASSSASLVGARLQKAAPSIREFDGSCISNGSSPRARVERCIGRTLPKKC